MSEYGITENGFVIKRLDVIKDELEKLYRKTYGEDVDLSPTEPFGQDIGILSKLLADQWELEQARYYAAYPKTASGVSLDHAVSFSEIDRLNATASVVSAALRGDEGTVIPAQFQANIIPSGETFQTLKQYTLSNHDIVEQFLFIESIAAAYAFTITIDGVDHIVSVNSSSSTTKEECAAAVASAVNNNGNVNARIMAIDFQNGAILLQSLSQSQTWSLTNNDENLTNWTPVIMSAVNTGKVTAPTFTLTEILTPVSGLDAINNFYPAVVGRETETDDALRLRREQSIRKPGSGTLDGMKSKMINDVSGVLDCIVTGDDDAHTVSFVVKGGTDADVAAEIWKIRGGGITLLGNVSVDIIDSQGKTQIVRFSRPEAVPIIVHVSITRDTQQTFPNGGDVLVKNNLVADGNSLSALGKNIIVKKLLSSVYKVQGCGPVDLTMSKDGSTFTDDEIELSANQYATFTQTNITVTVS